MNEKFVDCRAIAENIKYRAKELININMEQGIKAPNLVVVQVGDNPASNLYINNKIKACNSVGIDSQILKLPEDISNDELRKHISRLASDTSVNGILIQLPLPDHIDDSVSRLIPPYKDVDGLGPILLGDLMIDYKRFKPIIPCTVEGIIDILSHKEVDLVGSKCVVVGRSNIVGKPLANILTQLDATVTLCHSKTRNIEDEIRSADIIFSAVGKQNFIKADMIKEGAIIIDVGINRNEQGKMCGDVEITDELLDKVAWLTPVPYGVGQTTVARLLTNTCIAQLIQYNIGNYQRRKQW